MVVERVTTGLQRALKPGRWRRLPVLAVLAAGLAGPPASAQVVKQCLTPAELYTEQIVHYGVFLREAAWACNDMIPGTWTLWSKFDKSYGRRLAQQTRLRTRFFQRAFPKDWRAALAIFDGRLVTYFRHEPINRSYCTDVSKNLHAIDRTGWGAFTRQSRLVEDQVRLDYTTCGP
jgi:hypothetical protein